MSFAGRWGNETIEEKLTKYEVGANPNPPKKPRRSPKKGKVTPTNNVNAAIYQELLSGLLKECDKIYLSLHISVSQALVL